MRHYVGATEMIQRSFSYEQYNRHGDAAFADYPVQLGLSRRF